MDVRCERCRAQYVFDDDQVTPSGLTVQCTNCGHVFKVKVKELVVTVPVKPGEGDAAPIPATAAAPRAPASPAEGAPPPAATSSSSAPAAVPTAGPPPGPSAPSFLPRPDDKKEWRVRQANGNVFTFKELTTLQKWIVEQKVARDDEISLSGDQWKRLGNIAELASFFQVVEAAESAKAHAAAPAVTPIPMPSVSVYPVVQAPPGYPGGYPQGYPPAFTPPPYPPPPSFAAPPPPPPPAQPSAPPPAQRPPPAAQRSARPVGRPVDVKLDEADLKAVQTGGAWKVVLLLALVAAGGVGGAWAWRPELFAGMLGGAKPETPPAAEVPITFEVKPPATAPTSGAEAPPAPAAGEAVAPQGEAVGAEGAPQGDQSPLPAPVQEGDAPLPKSPEPVAKPEPEPEKPAPPPPPVAKTPKQLMAEADRLRTRGAVEKAVDLYERVIAAQPGNARALAGRGLCYLDLQQYALAEQSFRSALQADPGEEDALLGLAEAARYQGRKSEAIQHYERYLALHPDGEDAVAARNAINQLKE